MIVDVEGTSLPGRGLYAVTIPGRDQPLHLIATDAAAARGWLLAHTTAGEVATAEVTYLGSADRTETLIWKDDTR